jgi:hypothetical protein
MSDPKPIVVIMDEPLEVQLSLPETSVETWTYTFDQDGNLTRRGVESGKHCRSSLAMDERGAKDSQTSQDYIEYDGFGAVTSATRVSSGERYRYSGREFDTAAELYLRPGRCLYCADQSRRGVWLSEDGRIVPAGDPHEDSPATGQRP